jgi:prepilin-type processing-associated H-X9-DG protein
LAQPMNDEEASTYSPGSGGELPINKRFGSAHGAGFMATFADGHTQLLTFIIDGKILLRLGNRADREPIPGDAF